MNAPTTTATPTLQERAAAALEAEREAQARQHQEDEERKRLEAATALKRDLKERLGIDANPTSGEIVVEGLTFVYLRRFGYDYHPRYDSSLYLMRECHICGQGAASEITDLSSLARALEQAPDCRDTDRHAEIRAAERVTCRMCNGTGVEVDYAGNDELYMQCHKCHGTGTVPAHAEAREAQDVQQPEQTTVEHRIGRLFMDAVEAALLAARGEE